MKVSGSTAATDSDWLTIAGGQLADADLADASSYKAFFCGQGLGEDTNSTANGVNGDEFLEQTKMPTCPLASATSRLPSSLMIPGPLPRK